MRIAYLECFSGMSGDMFTGALIDAGVPARLFEETVTALNLGARLEVSRVMRSGISATKVDVWVGGEKDLPREEHWAAEELEHHHPSHAVSSQSSRAGVPVPHEHSNSPELSHSHSGHHLLDGESSRAGAPAPHEHSHPHEHQQSHGRGLVEIRGIISAAAISDRAKKTAIGIFGALGAAEGKIHNMPAESVHFHEVGAVDAIVDIVCAAVGAERLGAEEIVCSPLNVGGGTVQCAHGTFPVPAPATVELLKDVPVYSSGVQKELVTPTGAAIVKMLAGRFAAFPDMKIERSGYGAGARDFPRQPNVVRLTVGESLSAALGSNVSTDKVTVLEANLDDLNPQVFGYVMDRLFEESALDAFAVPAQMKKNRPGMLLTVLCKPEDTEKFTRLIFTESTTLGVRRREELRSVLARRWESVSTPWGAVRMKIGSMNGTATNFAPEYEDCRRIAAKHHVPLKTVMQEATRVYLGGEKL
ncbi:MAG TPA: nickel pincer cofactor biosynthesis protein LarC [Candidatus Sulfotelmatobacter sp.]